LIHGAQAEMRVLLSELRPTTLIDTELGELLLLLSNAFSGRTNIPVELTVSGEGIHSADIQEALYRICQESLNNIARHTKATQVEIELRHTPLGLKLLIRDNGCGFDLSSSLSPGHYGLNMMRERAEAVGAIINITSQLNIGTEIVIEWGEQEGL
jgi:signal transduction histidine kinase